MKVFELKNEAQNSVSGEYILGFQDTGSHACYMIYGVLKPKEKGRVIEPGKGHEEILLAMKGNLEVTGSCSLSLKEGSAFKIDGVKKCFLENKSESDAIYIIAGGHSEDNHH
ncbi:MAG: hypothetical protein A2Y97_03340 [Nitrospirae bacterium RBG_13_39_12]|nr:MAG: hypothetical protein A2Y97_03340 [Nitrospirae bacterium RBG_13_39_12]